jgi:hypothetical protein
MCCKEETKFSHQSNCCPPQFHRIREVLFCEGAENYAVNQSINQSINEVVIFQMMMMEGKDCRGHSACEISWLITTSRSNSVSVELY